MFSDINTFQCAKIPAPVWRKFNSRDANLHHNKSSRQSLAGTASHGDCALEQEVGVPLRRKAL